MEFNSKDSKYRKNREENQSKYIKSEEQRKEEKKKKKEHGKVESAKTRYEAYLEKEKEKQAEREAREAEEAAKALETEVKEVEEVKEPEIKERSKGSSSALFEHKKSHNVNPEAHYHEIENRPNEKHYNKAQVRRIIISLLFIIPTIILQLARFRIPLTPLGITIELSPMFELLGAIAYGPLTGLALVFGKNILYVILQPAALPNAISNVLSDSFFVIIASLLYARGMFSPKAAAKREREYLKNNYAKDKRRGRVFISGLVASITGSIVYVLSMNYITFPMIFHTYGVNADYYLANYQNALHGVQSYLSFVEKIVPEFKNLFEGTVFYNFPLTLFKFMVCTIAITIVYPPVSRVLHSRKK
ncbi:MAG: ECF transporter S component [Eubacterium sp.]|nr:ECF transporter S component [Eubacterium sp.]